MSTEPSDDIVRLATANNPAQAHIWEQELKRAGVRCRVVGDYLDAGLGDIPGLRAEIWVHRADLPQAEALLQELETASPESVEAEEEGA